MSNLLDIVYTEPVDFLIAMHKDISLRNRRKMLRCDKFRFWYCLWIEDTKWVWSRIETDEYRVMYCNAIRDRKALWQKIRNPDMALWYMVIVRESPVMRKRALGGELGQYLPEALGCKLLDEKAWQWRKDRAKKEFAIWLKATGQIVYPPGGR